MDRWREVSCRYPVSEGDTVPSYRHAWRIHRMHFFQILKGAVA
jgi:hypothetical protein